MSKTPIEFCACVRAIDRLNEGSNVTRWNIGIVTAYKARRNVTHAFNTTILLGQALTLSPVHYLAEIQTCLASFGKNGQEH
jgi:hypothetical protein